MTRPSLTASVASNDRHPDLGYRRCEPGVGAGRHGIPAPARAWRRSSSGGTKYAHTAAGGSKPSQSTHLQIQAEPILQPPYGRPTRSRFRRRGTASWGWAVAVRRERACHHDRPEELGDLGDQFTKFLCCHRVRRLRACTPAHVQPVQGWAWTVSNAGAASSTRGLTMDLHPMKRPHEATSTARDNAGAAWRSSLLRWTSGQGRSKSDPENPTTTTAPNPRRADPDGPHPHAAGRDRRRRVTAISP